MTDEWCLRRPDFLPGTQVRLGGGQEWTLPDPPARPAVNASGPADPWRGGCDSIGTDYEATVAAILDAEDEAGRLLAELALAICLLGRNYTLTPADYREILGGESG